MRGTIVVVVVLSVLVDLLVGRLAPGQRSAAERIGTVILVAIPVFGFRAWWSRRSRAK